LHNILLNSLNAALSINTNQPESTTEELVCKNWISVQPKPLNN